MVTALEISARAPVEDLENPFKIHIQTIGLQRKPWPLIYINYQNFM